MLAIFSQPCAFATELFEDVIKKTFPLDVSGSFSLRAIDGTVQIYGSRDNEVKVVATKKAFSHARLKAIDIRIEAKEGSVSVTTASPPKPAWGWGDRSGTVDYLIELPQEANGVKVNVPNGELVIEGMRGGPVSASLDNGRASLRNCFCNQTLRVGRGGFDLIFDWAEERQLAVDARINDGNVRAFIPADATFRIHAIAQTGHVVSDFADPQKRRRGGVTEVNEKIGNGPESTLELRALKGNIRLTEVSW
jgi:hypothetical protein